jgi:hypothetical protein
MITQQRTPATQRSGAKHLVNGALALVIANSGGLPAALAVEMPDKVLGKGQPTRLWEAAGHAQSSDVPLNATPHTSPNTTTLFVSPSNRHHVLTDRPTVSTRASDLQVASENEAMPSALADALIAQVVEAEAVVDERVAQADADTETGQADLAKASQNPIASLISVPFQNNTNFGVGDFDRTSNILNVQPVIPTPLSDSLTLVNRTIIPISYQPELAAGVDSAFGLGDINYTGFFVPETTGNFTWGVGPTVLLPTATDTVLGTGKWSLGPAAVGLVTEGPIVAGGLVSQLWSFAGDSDRADVSLFTFQPFFNYNFEGGWYLSTSPIITANWNASGEQWTLPIGGGGGRVFNIGSQPVNLSAQAFWNAVKPEGAADWTLRVQFTLLFP